MYREERPQASRTALVLAAVLAFALGSGFGAAVGFAAMRPQVVYWSEKSLERQREANDLRVRVIELQSENALLKAQQLPNK